MRHIEYNSDARNAYGMAHTSTLHCGRGAWRIDIVDAENDPFVRDILISRIPNVLTVYYDNPARENSILYQSKIRIELSKYSVTLLVRNISFNMREARSQSPGLQQLSLLSHHQ